MFMHVVILPAEIFLFCPDKVRMWFTSFGSTFSYRAETLIPVFHTTVFRQYTAFSYYWREMKGMHVGDSQVIVSIFKDSV